MSGPMYVWRETVEGEYWRCDTPIGSAIVKRIYWRGWDDDAAYETNIYMNDGVRPQIVRPSLDEAKLDAVGALIDEGDRAVKRLRALLYTETT